MGRPKAFLLICDMRVKGFGWVRYPSRRTFVRWCTHTHTCLMIDKHAPFVLEDDGHRLQLEQPGLARALVQVAAEPQQGELVARAVKNF